jgi:hypothetical protein
MAITDYLLLKPGKARMSGDEGDKVPTGRILISIAGLIIGIVASFFITLAGAATDVQKGGPASPPAVTQANTVSQVGQTTPNAGAGSEPQLKPFTWSRFGTVCLISLVICGLTYQGLYFSLRLYAKQPGFLILFVAFQYGYFWQSALKGASVLITK